MTNTHIYFENKAISTIDINGEPYIASKELAKALGYKHHRKIVDLYNRYKQDFLADHQFGEVLNTSTASKASNSRYKQDFLANPQIAVQPTNRTKANFINTGESSPLTTTIYRRHSNGRGGCSIRIFSLRGSMLIAMLSKTEVGVRFRKFILDILEGKQILPTTPQALTVGSNFELLDSSNKEITSISSDEINNAIIRYHWDNSSNQGRIAMIKKLFELGYMFKK